MPLTMVLLSLGIVRRARYSMLLRGSKVVSLRNENLEID